VEEAHGDGGWTAIAFLLRHDYLAYVAVSNAVLLAVHHGGRWRDAARRIAAYAGLSALLVAPWLLLRAGVRGRARIPGFGTSLVAAEQHRPPGSAVRGVLPARRDSSH